MSTSLQLRYTCFVYYTYLAKCADNSYYCGITTNIERREHEHNHLVSGAKYTASRRPVNIVYYEEYHSKSEALKREYVIKKMRKADKELLLKQMKN